MAVAIRQAGINLVHVSYKGSGPAITAAVSGEAPIVTVEIPSTLAQLLGREASRSGAHPLSRRNGRLSDPVFS